MSKKEILQDYMTKSVKPIFDKLISRLLIERPDDVYSFSIHWMQQQQNALSSRNQLSVKVIDQAQSDEGEEDEEIEDDAHQKQKSKQQNRTAVSAEVYGEYNKKEDFKARVIAKQGDQIKRIKSRILNSFMFQALDEKDLQIVIDAMEEKKFSPGDWVIKQGEDGDELYVIDEGKLECFKRFGADQEPKLLKTYIPGESFGELALLYNAPRAASIQAITDCITFALDRATFNNIVKFSAIKKREQMEEIMNGIELLQAMDPYERIQLSDVMKQINYPAGSVIINQNDDGDKIYLIIDGKLDAWKDDNGKQERVYEYTAGNYFGEMALLKNTPRQATVRAITDVELLYCDFHSFRRLMGPLENILQRNTQRYKEFLQE